MKKVSKLLLLVLFIFAGIDSVNAVTTQAIDYHGLYCGYQDNEGNFYSLVLNAFYKESQMTLETDDFYAEFCKYKNK